MMEVVNCPNCNAIYEKNKFRDVCPKCWRKEEEDFQTVKNFMRKRVNRVAAVEQIVTQTGVSEQLILKFIKKGRLQPSMFPNLGYPCDRCGRFIQKGNLCGECTEELRDELETFQKEEQRKKEIEKKTYLYKKN
jgi:flagellar operon protein (TIGR03826 family)